MMWAPRKALVLAWSIPTRYPGCRLRCSGFPFMAGDPLLGRFTFTRIFAGRSIGDYDDNGVVDSADYVVWQDAIGDAGDNLPADGNLDGKIDTDDYTIWRNHLASWAVPVSPPASTCRSYLSRRPLYCLRWRCNTRRQKLQNSPGR